MTLLIRAVLRLLFRRPAPALAGADRILRSGALKPTVKRR